MSEQEALASIITENRREFEKLAALPTTPRAKFSEAHKTLPSKLIKVITGPRRAGKSVFAMQLLKDGKVAYLNFDDDGLARLLSENPALSIEAALRTEYGEFEFCLFDEIQNLERWELLVNKLQRRGVNLVITGSNAKLLSQELATHLTGRYVEIEILPFSWTEYRSALGETALLENYLYKGGFPETVLTEIEARAYLENLVHAIILKDIVRRRKIRQPQSLLRLFDLLRTQFATAQTVSKITTGLQFASKTTTEKYLSYLEEAYLAFELERFSPKYREQIRSPRKFYPIDLGLCIDQPIFPDSKARRLEVLVFLELRRRYADAKQQIYSYQTKSGYEVDFAIKQGSHFVELIQSSYSLNDPGTIERETRSLFEAAEELRCKNLKIVTWEDSLRFTKDDLNISAVPIAPWLEDDILNNTRA